MKSIGILMNCVIDVDFFSVKFYRCEQRNTVSKLLRNSSLIYMNHREYRAEVIFQLNLDPIDSNFRAF